MVRLETLFRPLLDSPDRGIRLKIETSLIDERFTSVIFVCVFIITDKAKVRRGGGKVSVL